MGLIRRYLLALALLGGAFFIAPLSAADGVRLDQTAIVVSVPAPGTLVVRTPDGRLRRVRLIGLDAQSPCLSKQAAARARRLALGRTVTLVADLSQRSGRVQPVYVRLPRGVDLGHRLIAEGLAVVAYRTPFSRLRGYRIAQIRARAGLRGRWSSRCSELTVALGRDLSTVTVGNSLRYTVSVSNQRQRAATNLTLTLAFSRHVRVMAGGDVCPTSRVRIVCDLGRLPGVTSQSVHAGRLIPPPPNVRQLSFQVAPRAAGRLVARASVTSAKPEAVSGDNIARRTTAVRPGPALADLALGLRSEPGSPKVGEPYEYTITITNLGPSEATGVTIQDDVLMHADLREISCLMVCPTAGSGSLAPGQMAIIRLGVAPRSADPLLSTVTVRAATPDPNTANNVASSTVSPIVAPSRTATLQATVAGSGPTVRRGQGVSFDVTVRNIGPDPADEVVLRDFVSPLREAVFAGSTPDICTQRIVCRIGALPAGAETTVRLYFRAEHLGYGFLENHADLRSSTLDARGYGYAFASAEGRIGLELARAPLYVIGAHRLGRLHLSRRTSALGVTDAYGVEVGSNGFGEFCDRHWRNGLTITFVSFDGHDPCAIGGSAKVARAAVRTRRWATPAGLRVGDSVERLRALYPLAHREGKSFRLTRRRTRYGELAAGLGATVRLGRVRALWSSQGDWVSAT